MIPSRWSAAPGPRTPPRSGGWRNARHTYGNPLKYTDPSGHWSEEELAAVFGQNWQNDYFGAGSVFEGRDALLAMLQSSQTTDPISIQVIHDLMNTAWLMHAAGMSFAGVDAIGGRVSVGGGVGLGAGGSLDAVLNIRAGQLSGFVSGQAGVVLGETATVVGGLTLIRNLPTNDGLRAAYASLGIYGGDVVGLGAEVFYSAPLNDEFDPADNPNGAFIGGGAAVPGLAVYAMYGYSWEALRVDVSGVIWSPHVFSVQDVITSVGGAIEHDVIQHPMWPWSRYR